MKESIARPGQTVAIVGAGGGLSPLACQYTKAMALPVIAINVGEKKKMCLEQLGASKLPRSEYLQPLGTVVAIGLPAGVFLKGPVFETPIRMETIKGSYVGN
ncbi:MAG: hypothetical protein Q9205_004641 [Flavoplaca limonia]